MYPFYQDSQNFTYIVQFEISVLHKRRWEIQALREGKGEREREREREREGGKIREREGEGMEKEN